MIIYVEGSLDVSRNLPLKFGQNRVSDSWDIVEIEFLWWVVDVGGVKRVPPAPLGWYCMPFLIGYMILAYFSTNQNGDMWSEVVKLYKD